MGISKKEFRERIDRVSGLSPAQKEVFVRISEQTAFRQYAKKSKDHLNKICNTVKKQVKEWYSKKGEKIDQRGFQLPKQKGTTKKQLKEKIKDDKPVVEKKTQKANLPKVPKEVRIKITKEKKKEYRKTYNQRKDVKEANRIRKAKERSKNK